MATLTRKDDKTQITVLSNAVVDKLCAAFEAEKAELETQKKEKESRSSKKH